MERIIVVDCGKDMTKIVVRNADGTNTLSQMQTRVAQCTELTSLNKLTGANLQVVEYDGKAYAVGDPTGKTTDSNSKMDEIHKIMTLTAIANNVSNGDTVKVTIGCPLTVYMDKAQKDEYLDYILPKGRVEMVVDGKEKHFYITFRTCFAESMGPLFTNHEMFENSVVGVIDIGGLNINCAYFDNGKFVTDNCFTDKFGKLHIARRLRSVLNQRFDAQFAEFEVERILENGYVQNAESESRPLIEKALKDNISDIEEACKRNGWNIRFCKLVFIGGTSQLLREQLKERFPNAYIPENSSFANAEGFMMGLCKMMKLSNK